VFKFPAEAPCMGIDRLHALGLAVLNDLEGFERTAGRPTVCSEASLAQLTAALEADKQAGVSAL
jgi:hypothetical protein